ncbi:uncharacterized protein I206_101819 [Kwoniella pini CBS 10737]|uniref:Uncharacterized protein n=1 Tax=Kwoniella pini CBS 10737 TaxID=1296096 RepID=A0A1B9HVL0_9TREE|nr:uncharacterized protein I206_07091 [Kwoniella pini CBS 10737]OCF47312.1 hypothetical protein I206_07091 [Kwoniella pini CBS 10737]
MPKLITLTITPSYLGRTMQLCRGKRGYRHCELLEAITPRRLIIRNADVLRFGLPETVPPKIFEDVEELIFISPTEIPNGAGIPQLPKMAKLKRFTRIFWTDKPSDDWRSTPYNDRRWKILSVAYRTVRNLASAISSLRNGVQVLIVNSGPLQELCRDSDPGKSLREQTEEHIRTSLAFQAWGIYIQPGTRDSREDVLRAKAKFISDNIKYLTMEQYLNQGDWQDFLTSKEVDGWIDKEKFRPDNHY